MKRLERYEAEELEKGTKAYMFLTNVAFHRQLDVAPSSVLVPFGLGIPDFNRPGTIRLSDAYRTKQKHLDAHKIAEAFSQYTMFPATFDGSLPWEAFSGRARLRIGKTYVFEGIGENGLVGTITAATVSENEEVAYVAVTCPDGKSRILKSPMTKDELADYEAHSDAYFGRIEHKMKRKDDPFELFEWLMRVNAGTTRERILLNLKGASDYASFEALNDDDLLIAYCERLTANVRALADRKAQDRKSRSEV
jgi:hypothetical protein